jgi:uncharacterized protein
MKTRMKMPLFPLNAILCPRGRIPLQVFEPRYLDMISRCLKSGTEFVAVMLREGESGSDDFYQVGTLARLVDFDKGAEEGFIAITIEGLARVKLSDTLKMDDGLWVADIFASNEEGFVALPERYNELRVVLEALVKHPFVHGLNMDIDFHDGREVGWRLTELLPIDNRQKQSLFELQDPIQRLEALSDQLATMMI